MGDVMDWRPISTAPRDRLLLLTDGRRITVGRFGVYVQPESILDERQYDADTRRYGWGKVPTIPTMPNPRAGEREDVWHCCGMAMLDFEDDDDPLSDDHHGNRIEATMWAELVMPEAAHG